MDQIGHPPAPTPVNILGVTAPSVALTPQISEDARIQKAFDDGTLLESDLNLDNPAHARMANAIRERDSKRLVYMYIQPDEHEIPGPTLFLSVNARDWYIPLRKWCRVPHYVAMALETCRKMEPVLNDDYKPEYYRDGRRFAFSVQFEKPVDNEAKTGGIVDMVPKLI